MVCYFILRHICMIGSHRPVRRQGRKPGASSPTRWKLGRGGGRRQITKCSLSLAILPDQATGTTGKRYYRLEPVLPVSGTTAPFYRSLLTAPTDALGPQAVLPVPERHY